MSIADQVKSAIFGDKQEEMIKAGTLVVTRGIGVVGIGLIGAFFVLDQFDTGPWKDMSPSQKLWFVLGAGFIWALVAAADALARGMSGAADALARGMVGAARTERVLTLPSGLVGTWTDGLDSPGWHVAAVKLPVDGAPETVTFLLIKDDRHEWVPAKDVHIEPAVASPRIAAATMAESA